MAVKDFDPPSLEQQKALDVRSSVWVTASAGSGKTLVLIYRVLVLLLHGHLPERILCLTYTRAAVAEMHARIIDYLGRLSLYNNQERKNFIASLCPDYDEPMLQRAESLYDRVLNCSGGLKIMTLHAFCRSLLMRFPLEAGLATNLEAMDENEAKQMVNLARKKIMGQPDYHPSIDYISRFVDASVFDKQMVELISQRTLLKKHSGKTAKDRYATLRKDMLALDCLSVNGNSSLASIIDKICMQGKDHDLRQAVKDIEANATDAQKKKMVQFLEPFLSAKSIEEKRKIWRDYQKFFLTEEGKIRKVIGSTKLPQLTQGILQEEARRLAALDDDYRGVSLVDLSAHIVSLGLACLKSYAELKNQKAKLDYEDMIEKAGYLVSDTQRMVPWVLYRLDGGLDHILVDEAQDTSPAQWQILLALSEEFFTHLADTKLPRSIFIVGDEKQSIYSFQGADIDYFLSVKDVLNQRAKDAKLSFKEIILSESFRSLPSILKGVDQVFNEEENRLSIAPKAEKIFHQSRRDASSFGHVEIWPIFETEEKKPAIYFASLLAEKIKGLLESRIYLHATGKEIAQGDILILLKNRNDDLSSYLNRELSARDIKLSGPDQMKLGDAIAIEDMIAFARFLLLPNDDLNLACLLKSPFIGLDEEELFALASGRGHDSLWRALEIHAEEQQRYHQSYRWLKNALKRSLPVYHIFANLLYQQCPALHSKENLNGFQALCSRLGPDIVNQSDAFMESVIRFQKEKSASLEQFLRYFAFSEKKIKRDNITATDNIRIMTIHGAKGLEAPVVILPHMTIKDGRSSPWLWQEDMPLYMPREDLRPEKIQSLAEALKKKQRDENRRLLYVAMTRAEDRLYLTGYRQKPKKENKKNIWWNDLPEELWKSCHKVDFNVAVENTELIWKGKASILKKSESSYVPEIKNKAPELTPSDLQVPKDSLPSWFLTQAKKPDFQSSYHRASSLNILSPLHNSADALARGTNIHKILALLLKKPLVEGKTKNIIADYLKQQIADPEKCLFWTEALLTSLKRHQGSDFLSAEAISEQAVIGSIKCSGKNDQGKRSGKNDQGKRSGKNDQGEEKIISGKIDLLHITREKIFITEIKTYQNVPQTPSLVPQEALLQLASYYQLMRLIYPEKTCSAAFLWVKTAEIMQIPEEQLQKLSLLFH